MKSKIIILTSILLFSGVFFAFTLNSNDEDAKTAFSAKSIEFYGINYTKFKLLYEEGFIDKTGKSKCNSLKHKYFENWNDYFLIERSKFDISKNFILDANELILDSTNKWNAQIDVTDCIIVEGTHSVSDIEVTEIVKQYADGSKSGVGSVVIAEYISKEKKHGSYIYVYFDLNTGSILYQSKYEGAPSGMGFGVYWINSFYETLKLHKDHVKDKRKDLNL